MRNTTDASKFNGEAGLPYELRLMDFQLAMQDVYDFFVRCELPLNGEGPSEAR